VSVRSALGRLTATVCNVESPWMWPTVTSGKRHAHVVAQALADLGSNEESSSLQDQLRSS
jgi:hypothetical protein